MLTRRIRAALLAAAALTSAGCGDGPVQACPAIGHGSVVVVRLDGWPAGVDRSVEFVCAPTCAPPVLLQDAVPTVIPFPQPSPPTAPPTIAPPPTTSPTDPVVAVGPDGRASLGLYDQRPEELTVRVLEGGVVVAELSIEPEFVRVDGTEECGGNTEAVVVVPAP